MAIGPPLAVRTSLSIVDSPDIAKATKASRRRPILTFSPPFYQWTSVFASERLTGTLPYRITHRSEFRK